jgi:iron complex transport system ATP-binding protein
VKWHVTSGTVSVNFNDFVMTTDRGSFVELEHASVARGEKIVLHDISLRIASGEHIAVLGPNGCGKSTLIKTMTCECYPIAGEGMRARIFGRERWDVFELRKRLGVVAAEFPSERTLHTRGRDAVITGFFSSSTIWPELHVTEAMRERASAVLDQLEAGHLAEKAVGEMSAGEMRRVLIGRALVHAPEMLLIDEPSNALDLAAQSELRQTLRRLAQQGVGIVLITHHLADILPEIDRVVMLRAGKLFADGPKTELLTEDRLRELFGVPVTVARRDGFYHVW